MSLEGSVGEFGLVDIFQLIAMQKKGGVLTISCKSKEDVSVFFLEGTFIRAVSGDENERFADAMVSAEKITIAQLKMALRSVPKGSSVSETLVKLDFISPADAKNWNLSLTQDILFDLLSWKEGGYKFNQEVVSKREYEEAISVEKILMEGMRQADEWPALLRKIPSRDGVYERVSTENTDHILPEDDTTGLIPYINGVRTVNEIIGYAGIGAFPIYKELSILLSDGKIKLCDPKEKIEKSLISPDISFNRIKEFIFGSVVINGLIAFFVMLLFFLLLRPMFFSEKPFLQKMRGSVQEFKALSIANNKDIIEFSLNLYYLKLNRYPDTLDQLKKQGFLDQKIQLEGWGYSHDGSNFSLQVIDELQNK
jgi:hypothetical protein